jgi:DNA replication protein DnaC
LEKQKVSTEWLKDGGQFIPHPATWLNGRRWEDEAPPAAGQTAAPPRNPIFAGAI